MRAFVIVLVVTMLCGMLGSAIAYLLCMSDFDEFTEKAAKYPYRQAERRDYINRADKAYRNSRLARKMVVYFMFLPISLPIYLAKVTWNLLTWTRRTEKRATEIAREKELRTSLAMAQRIVSESQKNPDPNRDSTGWANK